MLRWRLISAAVIISVLLVLIWLDLRLGQADWLARPGLCLAPLAILLSALAAKEVLDLLGKRRLRQATWIVVTATMMVIAFSCVPILWREYPKDCAIGRLGWSLLGLASAVAWCFCLEMRRYRRPGQSIQRLSVSMFVVVYIGVLLSFLAPLRWFHDNLWGMTALVSTIVVVKLSDSGAYAVGKMFGKHKLAPRLSPGKTIEGAVGAWVTGGLGAWLFFLWIAPWIVGQEAVVPAWWRSIIYGLIVTSAGMIGDLAESLIKRDSGRKDSSSWLPGLGGVLDILDSVLAAAPAALVCWAAGLVGPGAT